MLFPEGWYLSDLDFILPAIKWIEKNKKKALTKVPLDFFSVFNNRGKMEQNVSDEDED